MIYRIGLSYLETSPWAFCWRVYSSTITAAFAGQKESSLWQYPTIVSIIFNSLFLDIMVRKIFLVLSILLVVLFGRSFFQEYLAIHPYYIKMLGNMENRKILWRWCFFALIPSLYLMYAKKKSFFVIIIALFLGLFFFSLTYISIKAELLGGGVELFFNSIFLLGLAIYMLVSFSALWSWVKEKILHLSTKKTTDILINMGLGLILFLLINSILVLTNLFYMGVSWLIFIWFAVLIFFQREQLKYMRAIIAEDCSIFTIDRTLTGRKLFSLEGLFKVFFIILLLLSIRYIFNGFQLAYLPYPTAWDANHAYMFYPKMRALNNGYYRDEISMASWSGLRYMFIAYFFSLFSPHGFMGISADTIAIQMNFWSGIFVLLFGLWLVSLVLSFLKRITKHHSRLLHQGIFLLGWFLLLQWLTSGMWAFLVFIDNKTDLGVLALIILAISSGFLFLEKLTHHEQGYDDEGKEKEKIIVTKKWKNIWKYIWLSWVFYACAALAKPTAMFDVLNFGLFLRSTWFSWLGVMGISLLIVGALTLMKFRGIRDYLPQTAGFIPLITGVFGLWFDTILLVLKRTWKYLLYLLAWIGIFLATVIIVKVPYLVTSDIVYERETSVRQFVEKILFSYKKAESHKLQVTSDVSWLRTKDSIPLYTQVGDVSLGQTCTLRSQWFSSSEDLYENTKKAPGSSYDEDVGRYIGYGWKGNPDTDTRRWIKPFINPWWFFKKAWCYGFNPLVRSYWKNAKILCETEADWKSLDLDRMQWVLDQLSSDLEGYETLEDLVNAIQSSGSAMTREQLQMTYGPQLREVDKYMQDNTIKVEVSEGKQLVYFPYKYLNPFNNSFNRSLQNLSSYYTDIGVVRIMLFLFIFVGLLYAIVTRNRTLLGISLVTLFGWVMRWFIGGGILRYAIGIVIWTILSFIVYLYYLLWWKHVDEIDRTLSYIFVIVFIIYGGFQLGLNMLRISSQWWGWAFVRYRTNHGQVQEYDEQLQPIYNSFKRTVGEDGTPRTLQTNINKHFNASNVFNMQFAHYKKFLDLKNTASDDEGALIAGTYARYFVKNQHYVKYDQFLTWLWEQFSDGDVCNSYLRLKDKHIKYLVIDPNIGTVVQGAGNQSLFDRFFGRIDTTNNTIVEDGAITMLAKLYQAGYVRYISSNNLWAKYAFIMPDSVLWWSGDTLTLMRSRMSVARFFGGRDPNNALVSAVTELAEQRVKDGTFITDIADVLWLQIDEQKIMGMLAKGQLDKHDRIALSQDERKAMVQYLSLRQLFATQPKQAKQQLKSIVMNSMNTGNQIIVLEVE